MYASYCLCKVMLTGPKLKTLGDVGEFAFGRIGRFAFTASQLITCLLVPTAFLALGAIFLDGLFVPNSLSKLQWMLIIVAAFLPVVLQKSLKEAAWASLLGSVAVMVSVFLCIGFLVSQFSNVTVPIKAPEPSAGTVIQQFGTLAVAYGAGTAIPALFRIHKDKPRMPYVVTVTVFSISLIFLSIAVTGYVLIGCQIAGNVVFELGSNGYGMVTPRWIVIVSYAGMLLHITMAFAIILHPALYVIENMIFVKKPLLPFQEMSGEQDVDQQDYRSEESSLPPNRINESISSPLLYGPKDEAGGDPRSPTVLGPLVTHSDTVQRKLKPMLTIGGSEDIIANRILFVKTSALRIAVVAACVATANLLVDQILSLLDFIGAFCGVIVNVALPILCYTAVNWKKIALVEKIVAVLFLLACCGASAYCSYINFMAMAYPTTVDPSSTIVYPFCPAGQYQETFYTHIPKSSP
jgi:vesicular inhibitory amino acid transporter